MGTPVQEALASFRTEVREWCTATIPADWRQRQTGIDDRTYVEFQQWWRGELQAKGWMAPHWPQEWGGSALSLPEQVALFEELVRADAPRLSLWQVGLYNAAPAIIAVGTPEQKRKHLPSMLEGKIWCQGFSEPGAGSDLASLTTRAERHGDEFIVNGQKVWTSNGHLADWCILLARTDQEAPKRRGITYFLVDMKSPGIEARTIKDMSGERHFCETFFTDVVIPIENVLGDVNDGWRVTQSTLASERAVTILEQADALHNNGILKFVKEVTSAPEVFGMHADDPYFIEMIGQLYVDSTVLKMLCDQMITEILSGDDSVGLASYVKVFYSEVLQRFTAAATTFRGLPGQVVKESLTSTGWVTGDWYVDWLHSWGWTIGGGTNEIMRNIISEQLLGLPREPQVTA